VQQAKLLAFLPQALLALGLLLRLAR
jgi:hypothetical protein